MVIDLIHEILGILDWVKHIPSYVGGTIVAIQDQDTLPMFFYLGAFNLALLLLLVHCDSLVAPTSLVILQPPWRLIQQVMWVYVCVHRCPKKMFALFIFTYQLMLCNFHSYTDLQLVSLSSEFISPFKWSSEQTQTHQVKKETTIIYRNHNRSLSFTHIGETKHISSSKKKATSCSRTLDTYGTRTY